MIKAVRNPQKIQKWINYLAILYAFCLPLSRAGLVFSSLLLVILWFAEGRFKEKFIILKSNCFVVAALVLTGYMAITLLWSDVASEGFYHFKRLWYYLVLFIFVTSLQRKFIPLMVGTLLTAMFISEILSYGIFFELWTLRHGSPNDPTPFMNHLEYSFYLCATSALLLVKLLLEKESFKLKLIYGTFFLSAVTNLFITGGRAGQIAFILVITALFIFNLRNKVKGALISVVILSGILVTAISFSPTFQDRMLAGVGEVKTAIESNQYKGSWGTRLEFWDVGLSAVKEEPIFGIGIGDITRNLKEGKERGQAIQHVPSGGYHSDFLETIVAGGLVGAIIFISIFIFLWKAKVKDPLVNNMRIIVTILFGFGLIADNFLRAQFTIVLFTFFVGIIFAQQRHEKTNAIQS